MQQTITTQKPHYEILDGLRGIAAIVVLIFHIYEILTPNLADNPFGHGFLAVDFFFCLSGFVIGYAYDDRMSTLSLKDFFINRLIRLHPLVILASLIGLVAFLLAPYETTSPLDTYHWSQIITSFICSILLIPNATVDRFTNVFPLNAPSWSLSMEYLINIVYALLLVRINKKTLFSVLIVATVIIISVAQYRGNILGGWSSSNYFDGCARVSFSFIMGLVIYRFQWIIKNKIHILVYAVLLMGILAIPHTENDWIIEMLIVVGILPLLVALSAGAKVSGTFAKISTFIGNLSYPLYMLHYWIIWIFAAYVNTTPDERTLHVIIGWSIVPITMSLSYFALKIYDEPLRKFLKRKLTKRV